MRYAPASLRADHRVHLWASAFAVTSLALVWVSGAGMPPSAKGEAAYLRERDEGA